MKHVNINDGQMMYGADAKPIFTQAEMNQLREKCDLHISKVGGGIQKINYLYRNKPATYFSPIEAGYGQMVPYLKDMGGDPKCPINGHVNGLFFSGTLYNGGLPTFSPFGERRFVIPAGRLFNTTKKLYFSDFFCMRGFPKNHYVSLVITTPDSEADIYCREKLIPLDILDNDYLKLDQDGNVWLCHGPNLWVEVMYTDTINVKTEQGAYFTDVEPYGYGSSKPFGLPKIANCPICNI